ncbi:MAG: hypothetical protein OEW24_01545 [Chloroflexota bacterium]|nr:hypothetical protein [Chloroflexota bacterium]
MSRGASYLGLLAALKQEEILREARSHERAITVIEHRRRQSLGASLLRALRARRP